MEIETSWVKTEASDKHKLDLYCATPKGAISGGIVIIQEIFGVNAHIQQVCQKYAKEGYLTVAPALFDRVRSNVEFNDYSEEDMNKGFALRNQLKWDEILHDVEAAWSYLQSKAPVNTVVIGYCFGGSVAWRAVTQLDKFKAAVCYYGGQIHDFANEKPHCPVMLHFGTKDPYIMEADRNIIRRLRLEVSIYEYDASHGFNCDMRGSYDAISAESAYGRTLGFLKRHF